MELVKTFTDFFWNQALSIYFKFAKTTINHRRRRLMGQTVHFPPRSENIWHNQPRERMVWENKLFWITQSAEESELFEKITWAILRDMTAPNQSPRPVVKTNRLQALKPGLVGGGLPGFHEHSQNCISVFQLLLFSICHSLHFLPKIGITVVEWEPGLCDALDSKYGILGLTLTQ